MKKILVTGAQGLLGSKLSELLLKDDNFETILTGRRFSVVQPDNAKFITLDITDRDAVLRTIKEHNPDVVINTAAMTQVDDCEIQRDLCWTANVKSVEYLVEACEAVHAHLIHVSTDFIFDGTQGPLTEDAKPNPVNYYGESKLAAEQVVMKSKTPWAILRTVLVYGITSDMSRSNIVLWVKNNLEQGKTIKVVNDQWRTPTLAEDLAMGCYLAATKKAQGVYNISGSDFLSPYQMAVQTADFFKLDKSLIQETDSTLFTQPAKRPPKTGFIIDKAKKDLGYQPRSFNEGLAILARQIKESVKA